MEQKIIHALLLRNFMTHHAWARQKSIADGIFDAAMTQQFFHHQYRDELYELEDKMNTKEYVAYLQATYCRDYQQKVKP